MEHDSKVFSVEEAGLALGVGRQLAYELVRQGKIPSLRLGRRLVVPKAALDRMLAEAGVSLKSQ
ncbi:MAG: helix-turn-helix domain-containing protein [Chloroflexota bacterium]